jgi:hypothetical protein
MTDKELAENLLSAYLLLKGCGEHLQVIKGFSSRIEDKSIIDAVNQLNPKINYFNKMIENTLFKSVQFDKENYIEIEERMFQLLEDLNNEIKNR